MIKLFYDTTFQVKNIIKDGEKENFIRTAKELIEKSRAEEGNISYGLYEDVENLNVLTFIEEWKDMDAISFHNSTEYFKRIVPMLAEFREGSSEVSLYKEV